MITIEGLDLQVEIIYEREEVKVRLSNGMIIHGKLKSVDATPIYPYNPPYRTYSRSGEWGRVGRCIPYTAPHHYKIRISEIIEVKS